MEPYRAAFRGEVLAACDAHEGTRAIAVRFKVSDSWVRRLQQQRRETGQTVAKQAAPRQPKWHAWSDWLLAKLAARPDIYLRELQAELKQERGIKVCLTTLCNACRTLEQSRKKRRESPASKIAPTLPRNVLSGELRRSKSIPTKSFSSTKHGPKRT